MGINVGILPKCRLFGRHLLKGHTDMIFVTLGSQKFQFNRLLRAVDQLIDEGIVTEDVFAQTGYSDYKPRNFQCQPFLDRETFSEKMGQADIVITHGGTGAIIGAVKQGKKVVAVPRLAKYGEHVDDHQIQIIRQFSDSNLILFCMDGNLKNALEVARNTTFNEYKSNTDRIINSLIEFIER